MADGALEVGGPGRSEELRGRRLKLGEGEFLVLIFPPPAPPPLAELTAAEREVVARVLEGATTAAIAAMRQTSPRTVANQLQSIFRKLGVASRAELARCFAGVANPGR